MARGANPETVRAVGELLDGFYGLRYIRAIAKKCELPADDARRALEISWIALLPRVRLRYGGDPLGHLTHAISRAIYGANPDSASLMIGYFRESICIDRFAERVQEREEPHIEDCLKAELFYFFAEDDPGPYKAAIAMPGA